MNQLVLVTGATGGVGASVCRHLSQRYQVIAVARDEHKLHALCAEVPCLISRVADLSDREAVDRLLDSLVSEFAHIPHVINNAGVNKPARIDELEPIMLDASIQVNALAPLQIMRRLLPAMREHDYGRIVNITSGAPLNCFPGFGSYSASKATLNALTVTAARENADRNIKINLMSPGPVRSGMAPKASMQPDVCHPTLDYLLSLEADGPTGKFFWLGRELPLFPDLEGVAWLEGTASERFPKVF